MSLVVTLNNVRKISNEMIDKGLFLDFNGGE